MLNTTDMFAVCLEVQQWNQILTALMEVPYKIAAPLIAEIQIQSQKASAMDLGDGG